MSQVTAITLLSQTTAVTTGNKQPAACYYISGNTLQTLTWKLTGLLGTVVVQATLADDPTDESDWFAIYNIVCTSGNGNGGTLLEPKIGFININGNFAWVRAKVVSYTSGTINYLKVCY
jgi:hypothetical protein